ncbi:MAG: nucleotidyltransferase domain-containing protein [Actinobacteria bacterium]|nr:MAG: nucleotidyltransferase domain-containing protein [Actinomycetota bacterium]
MPTPTEHLRVRARRIVEEARRLVPLRAALLAGSAGRGDADFYSDIDLLLYVDELPTDETVAAVRDVVGGTDPSGKERTEQACGEEFDLDGVHAEMVFFKVREFEARLDDLLDRLVDFDAPTQKILMGLAEGLALEGADLIERWRARVSDFPEPLRRAMIERYWTFFPLWYYTDVLAERDAELWRLDVLVEAAFNLLGVLSALNRLYFTRFELKGMRAMIGKMELAPVGLADRVESLFDLEPSAAAGQLGRLVEETRALVLRELPDLDLPLPHPPGTQKEPWSL